MVNKPAIVTLTPAGRELGQRLVAALGGGEVVAIEDGARQKLAELFQAGRPLICIMALGIVVRILGPLVKDKATDPPVVVVDEGGQFAISVLGGHVAGANELTRQVAQAINARPVITTSSDVLGLPALDLLGREWGWKIESHEHLKTVSAALVRGERIAVYQDAGRRDWWQSFSGMVNCCWIERLHETAPLSPEGSGAAWWVLAITDHAVPGIECFPHVMYRPPSLVLGVGCKRGVRSDEIGAFFQQLCVQHRFSPLSLGVVATVSLKADEPGIVEFAARHEVPLRVFAVEELAQVQDVPTPSDKVRERIGIAGVAEPAALLAAGVRQLLLPKQCNDRIALAIARREDA